MVPPRLRVLASFCLALAVGASTADWATASVVAEVPTNPDVGPAYASEDLGPLDAYTTISDAPGALVAAEVFASPVNYLTDGGTWAPIETDLLESSRNGFDVESRENEFSVYMPENAASRAVRIESNEHWLTFKPAGVDGAPQVEANTAVYDGPEVDSELIYEVENTRLKESVTLAEPPPSDFDLTTTLKFSAGLTPVLDLNTNTVSIQDVDGLNIFTIPAPFMYDSSPNGASNPSYDLETKLTAGDGSWTLRTTPSDEWLRNPQRVYPVTIDPTVEVYPPNTDCWANEYLPSIGYCGTPWLWTGIAANGDRRRSLLNFPNVELPAGAQFVSASLQMYMDATRTRATAPANYFVKRMSHAWNYNATWQRRSGSSRWAALGGDFDTYPSESQIRIAGELTG